MVAGYAAGVNAVAAQRRRREGHHRPGLQGRRMDQAERHRQRHLVRRLPGQHASPRAGVFVPQITEATPPSPGDPGIPERP